MRHAIIVLQAVAMWLHLEAFAYRPRLLGAPDHYRPKPLNIS